jgi:hypothetical protein
MSRSVIFIFTPSINKNQNDYKWSLEVVPQDQIKPTENSSQAVGLRAISIDLSLFWIALTCRRSTYYFLRNSFNKARKTDLEQQILSLQERINCKSSI